MSAKNEKSGKAGAAVAPVNTVVQDKIEVAHSAMVVKVGKEIIAQTGKLAEKYWELITYIRKNSVAPKLVSFELTKLGFKRSRVSEVNRVANAANDVYKNYEAKMIGLDKALEMARMSMDGSKAELTPAARQLVVGGVVTEGEAEAEMQALENEAPSGGGKKKETKSVANRLKAIALDLAMMAGVNSKDKLPLEWHFECATVPGGWLSVRVCAAVSGEVKKD